MALEQRTQQPGKHAIIVRGAEDQVAGLERLWALGETADPQADEEPWQVVRRALNAYRGAEGARQQSLPTVMPFKGCHCGCDGACVD